MPDFTFAFKPSTIPALYCFFAANQQKSKGIGRRRGQFGANVLTRSPLLGGKDAQRV